MSRFDDALPGAWDTDSHARARRRVRRVSATAVASGLAAVVQLAVGLLVVPLSLRYLGNERYGLWMAVSSLTAMVTFADFGMGNGLLNVVASADGRGDRRTAGSAVSSALLLLTGVAVLFGALFWATYPFVRWESVVNASGPALAGDARLAVAATLMCAVASLPLGVSQRVQMAYQEGFINSGWSAAGTLAGLLALLVAIGRHAPLPVLVLCLAAAPVAGLAANGVTLFGWRRPELRPRAALVSGDMVRHLLGAGALFFAIQLAGAVGYQLPTLVIARLMDPAAVTTYVVPFRLFMVMPSLTGFFLTPLWPAYREALTRGDVDWVKRIVRKSAALAVALNAGWGLALVVFGPAILHWWVGGRVEAPLGLRVALAVWVAMTGLAGPLAMFLNGAGALRFQAVAAWSMAVVSIGLCTAWIPHHGVTGAATAMIAAQAACVLVPCLIYVPRLLRSMQDGHSAIR